MCRPIFADEAGTIEAEDHMALRQRYIMDELIIGSLHEGRVDIAHRDKAFRRQTRGESYSMLFSDTYIEGALGILLHHKGHRAAGRHSGSNGDDTLIPVC